MTKPQSKPLCSASASRNVRITERDQAILTTLLNCKVMTIRQAASIHFEGRNEAAKKRLQKLKKSGLIREIKRLLCERSVMVITARGREAALNSVGPGRKLCSKYKAKIPGRSTLEHDLAVLDIKAAMHESARSLQGWELSEFSVSEGVPEIKVTNEARAESIRPDAYICLKKLNSLSNPRTHELFLELDRSTKTLGRLTEQIKRYVNLHRSGGFASLRGGKMDEGRRFPFRLLLVLASEERRNNIAERLSRLNPPVQSLIWLTTFQEATSDPFGPIWIQPKDYIKALKGTRFDPSIEVNQIVYSRRHALNATVDALVIRSSLL